MTTLHTELLALVQEIRERGDFSDDEWFSSMAERIEEILSRHASVGSANSELSEGVAWTTMAESSLSDARKADFMQGMADSLEDE